MPDEPRRVYWDSNVPLSYLNAVPDRLPVIEELFAQARAKEIELLTSSISRVEVAYIQSEKDSGQLDQATEDAINNLWAPGSPIKPVEFYDLIADKARALMRQAVSQGWGALKPMDLGERPSDCAGCAWASAQRFVGRDAIRLSALTAGGTLTWYWPLPMRPSGTTAYTNRSVAVC
jgi:hypothetical protein